MKKLNNNTIQNISLILSILTMLVLIADLILKFIK